MDEWAINLLAWCGEHPLIPLAIVLSFVTIAVVLGNLPRDI